MSQHKWFTVTGALSRALKAIATNLYGNDIVFVLIFMYGAVELFGIRKTVKLFKRARKFNKAVKSKKRGETNGKTK